MESVATLYTDQRCIDTFLASGKVEGLLGYLQVGFDTLS
jgi:hypothetical protein